MRNLTQKQYLGIQERARSEDIAFASYVEDNQRANSAGEHYSTQKSEIHSGGYTGT